MLDSGIACLKAAADDCDVELGSVESRWEDEPASPVVRKRIAEHRLLAA